MSVVDRSWASRFSRSRRASSTGQTTMSAPASVSRCLFFGLFATDMIRGTPNSFLACLVAVILARSSLVATRRRSVCDASAFLRMSGLEPSSFRMVASDTTILNEDGSKPDILKKAEASQTDLLLVATSDDRANITATRHAKKEFGVPRIISVANSPKNKQRLTEAGADIVVCPVELALRDLE